MGKNAVKEKLYRQLAEEYGATIDEVRQICESQFSFLRGVIEHGAFDSILIYMFGRFYVNPYRLHKINITKPSVRNETVCYGRFSVTVDPELRVIKEFRA